MAAPRDGKDITGTARNIFIALMSNSIYEMEMVEL